MPAPRPRLAGRAAHPRLNGRGHKQRRRAPAWRPHAPRRAASPAATENRHPAPRRPEQRQRTGLRSLDGAWRPGAKPGAPPGRKAECLRGRDRAPHPVRRLRPPHRASVWAAAAVRQCASRAPLHVRPAALAPPADRHRMAETRPEARWGRDRSHRAAIARTVPREAAGSRHDRSPPPINRWQSRTVTRSLRRWDEPPARMRAFGRASGGASSIRARLGQPPTIRDVVRGQFADWLQVPNRAGDFWAVSGLAGIGRDATDTRLAGAGVVIALGCLTRARTLPARVKDHGDSFFRLVPHRKMSAVLKPMHLGRRKGSHRPRRLRRQTQPIMATPTDYNPL